MNAQGPNPMDSLGGSPNEERLGALINEYFDRVESGEHITKEDFLAEHPDCADQLREHLVGLDLIEGLGSSSGGQTLPGGSRGRRAGSSAVDLPADAPALPVIPGYDIHKLIGRGGMGLVYKATQVSTKRVVALKLLMEGPFATDSARKRFEREIALAAQLRHSNIIPIYDSGTCDGRMYYAMEHIYGMSLIDHVRSQELDIKARLRLFVKVCSALSHAHVRGVIHRDLKPSNILVDGAGEPHILDFGLAKAGTFGDMSTSLTAAIVGTPAYMSPEQASGDPGGIDIRTDVYSLGMILYEMLTFSLPYETNTSMGKILHNIAHAEPKHPGKLNNKIDGDLAAIALKALEKNKETRYQSVDAFAQDVTRYLAGEPIMARPPSGLYLLKKVVLKHRVPIGVVATLFVIGMIGLVMINRYSAKLAVEQQNAREQSLARQRAEEQLQAKQAAIEAEQKRQAQEREQSEAIIKNLPPEARKTVEQLGSLLSGGLSPEASWPTLAKRAIEGLGEGQAASPKKSTDFDPSDLYVKSEKVPAAPPEPAKSKELEDKRKQVETTLELLKQQYLEYQAGLAKANATSQPAATQPAASQPTSAPAVTP